MSNDHQDAKKATRQDNLERGADEAVAYALMIHEDTMRVMRDEQKDYKYTPAMRDKALDILVTFGLSKPGRKNENKPVEYPTFNVFIGPKETKQLPVAESEVVLEHGD